MRSRDLQKHARSKCVLGPYFVRASASHAFTQKTVDDPVATAPGTDTSQLRIADRRLPPRVRSTTKGWVYMFSPSNFGDWAVV